MGVVAPLTFARVRQVVTDSDLPGRLRRHGAEVVRAAYGYGAPVGSTIEHLPRAERLMPLARQRVREYEEADRSFPSGMVLLADELSGGRGRFQREWHAPAGGLWLTLVLANTLLPAFSRLIPLAAGAACCEAIRACGVEARVKWVNDVLFSGRKLCGVLCESFRSPVFGEEYVLVGIGVNVNNLTFPPELRDTAVSLREILGRVLDLPSFAARLLASLSWHYGLLAFDEEQRLASDDGSGTDQPGSLLLAGWQELSDSVGRRVWFGFDVQRQPQYQALVLGLTPDGGLRLRHLESGAELVEHSGEILYID
jgi:BirA family transcriptional regulator, biotin operon repressor / biotin---[acetyl-CoA-carboxylase] ligase